MCKSLYIFFAVLLFIYGLGGCSPTYPKDKFNESIVRVCKNEYKIDVKVEAIGKTIAIYLPLENLIDFTFAITKSASEKINDVILSVSRVALSTDAKFDFYCIIAHDVRIPELQIVIIKSVDDVKRFLLSDISRGEYSKRMLIDIRLNPQAQKEHAIKQVFSKMAVDSKWQDQVMNDFFRSEPAVLGDMGYWNGRFYIKDITLSEFLADEIASRVRFEFKEDKFLSETFVLKSSKGTYISKDGKNFFKFEIEISPKGLEGLDEKVGADKITDNVLKVAALVLHGYRFDAFDYIEIINQTYGNVVKVSKSDLENFRMKKVTLKDIIK